MSALSNFVDLLVDTDNKLSDYDKEFKLYKACGCSDYMADIYAKESLAKKD